AGDSAGHKPEAPTKDDGFLRWRFRLVKRGRLGADPNGPADFPQGRSSALHGLGPEVGLLEWQRFLIQERAAGAQAVTVYDILDPTLKEKIGIVREQS